MPPKDSATEMLYKILDNVTGISFNYDTKTGLTYATEANTAYDKITVADKCYVGCATDHKCSQCENWKQKEEETKMKNDTKPAPVYGPFAIRSVLSNHRKNAFSVVWMDGTTTVVHCQPGDEWDDEKALAMCFTKKALGNKGNFNDKFNDALDNKMKVISANPEVKAEAEKFVEEIEALKKEKNAFGVNEQTATELAKAANKTSNSMKDMINALTGETSPKVGKIEKTREYKIFLYSAITNEKKMLLARRRSVQDVRDFVKNYGKEAGHGWYFRTWNADGGMYIDYGSYSNYLFVEGMDNSEYVKK